MAGWKQRGRTGTEECKWSRRPRYAKEEIFARTVDSCVKAETTQGPSSFLSRKETD